MPLPKSHPAVHRQALRAVATIELTKGVIVLLAGFGLLSLLHRDIWGIADSLLEFLHISPDRRFAQIFLDWADKVTDRSLLWLTGLAWIYSILRFIEGYGLWYERAWAEWLALVSGSLYLPFEIHDLVRKPNLIRAAIVLINLAVVLYMLFLRLDAIKHKSTAIPQSSGSGQH
jgi:uncharacterized membrane protein (DUF2068 family)